MTNTEFKATIDGVETTFVIRKPKFSDTVAAMDSAGINLDSNTNRPKASAAQFMRSALFRTAKCIVSPAIYNDATKLGDLPEDVVQDLISAVDNLTQVSPKSSTPSAEASA